MRKYFVRWLPPYPSKNQFKEQECESEEEALLMVGWFTTINVYAKVVIQEKVYFDYKA